MLASVGAEGAFSIQTFPTAPPGSVPVNTGFSVSPPVYITTAFVAKFIHSSSTSYSYTAVQLQSVIVTSESISVAVTNPQLSVYNAAMLATVGAEGAFSIQTFPTAPPGSVPVNTGSSVSPPVYVTIAFVAKFIHSSSTVYSYTAVQLQSVPVTSE